MSKRQCQTTCLLSKHCDKLNQEFLIDRHQLISSAFFGGGAFSLVSNGNFIVYKHPNLASSMDIHLCLYCSQEWIRWSGPRAGDHGAGDTRVIETSFVGWEPFFVLFQESSHQW